MRIFFRFHDILSVMPQVADSAANKAAQLSGKMADDVDMSVDTARTSACATYRKAVQLKVEWQ